MNLTSDGTTANEEDKCVTRHSIRGCAKLVVGMAPSSAVRMLTSRQGRAKPLAARPPLPRSPSFRRLLSTRPMALPSPQVRLLPQLPRRARFLPPLLAGPLLQSSLPTLSRPSGTSCRQRKTGF